MTWRVRIEVRTIPARFVVVRAISEAGQVFCEATKDASQRDATIKFVRDYCIARGWEILP